MKENGSRTTNVDIRTSIEGVLKPWSKIAGHNNIASLNLPEISIIEIARKANISPQRVLRELPETINVNGAEFRVHTASLSKTHIPMKKLVRESVKEPPIKGVRNGRKRLNESVLTRKIRQEQANRRKLTFKEVDPNHEDHARSQRRMDVRTKIAERRLRKVNEKGEISGGKEDFLPEKITLANGVLENPDTISIKTSFADVLGLASHEEIFPQVELRDTVEETLASFLGLVSIKAPTIDLIQSIIAQAKKGNEVVFGTMCLPCLNPNPFITDHPSLSINAATAIFLTRINHIASQIEMVIQTPVRFNIAREIEHMQQIFPFTEDQIKSGIDDINDFIAANKLHNVRICTFPLSNDADANISQKEIGKFLPAFRKSQRFEHLDPITAMRWLGVINEADARSAARRKGIDLEIQLKEAKSLDAKALQQARIWASIRHAPWKTTEDMVNSIIVSVRPGSSNFTITPVSEESAEKLPMLPHHSSVGITEKGTIITMKRVNFLLKPKTWIEVITEFGSVFINKSLI